MESQPTVIGLLQHQVNTIEESIKLTTNRDLFEILQKMALRKRKELETLLSLNTEKKQLTFVYFDRMISAYCNEQDEYIKNSLWELIKEDIEVLTERGVQ